jgi:hypothetical protein
MLYVTVIGIIIATLVAYTLFKPSKTRWNPEVYDKPQEFTDVGLAAEWDIPLPEEATQSDSKPADNVAAYGSKLLSMVPPPAKRGPVMLLTPRKKVVANKKHTLLGVEPANNRIGIVPHQPEKPSGTDLVNAVHNDICQRGCDSVTHINGQWHCKCGQVTRYANQDGPPASTGRYV